MRWCPEERANLSSPVAVSTFPLLSSCHHHLCSCHTLLAQSKPKSHLTQTAFNYCTRCSLHKMTTLQDWNSKLVVQIHKILHNRDLVDLTNPDELSSPVPGGEGPHETGTAALCEKSIFEPWSWSIMGSNSSGPRKAPHSYFIRCLATGAYWILRVNWTDQFPKSSEFI